MSNETVIMVPIPSSQTSHRKNRRRERPGARKRHALALAHEVAEGISMASDFSLDPPLHHSHSQSCQHHQYDRNWKAWKAREAENRAAIAEKEKHSAREKEREAYTRLFGGEADDDVSLCENMLGVVYSLWGGIDYIDP